MPGHDQRRNVGEALPSNHDENADAADDIDFATFNVLREQMRGKIRRK